MERWTPTRKGRQISHCLERGTGKETGTDGHPGLSKPLQMLALPTATTVVMVLWIHITVTPVYYVSSLCGNISSTKLLFLQWPGKDNTIKAEKTEHKQGYRL